jgi:DNA polymerase-3 subunit delta'
MLFRDIVGQEAIKEELFRGYKKGRIPHCQLFYGPKGCGSLPLAIAYARMVLCEEEALSNQACNLRVSELKHPDLHFIFPVANNQEIKTKAISANFLPQWRVFLHSNSYASLYDWFLSIGIENKQGKIGKDEVSDLVKKMSLKSYEGGWKVAILWMAERMNLSATNKLLKLIEEPPEKTLFLFVSEDIRSLADTLISRCQKIELKPLSSKKMSKALIEKGYSKEEASSASVKSTGNFHEALKIVSNKEDEKMFEEWFVSWVRSAFAVRKNKEAVLDLVAWSKNISKTGRETQKSFLSYSLDLFRQSLLKNYFLDELTTYSPSIDFNFKSFSNFISGNNIDAISLELETAYSNIQSNGNSNMIFMDLSLKLTRLLHKK